MKKILTWSVIPPFNEYSVKRILSDNLIGSNTGNLLFHASVARALMTDADVEYETVFSGVAGSLDETAARVNEECECFVIPLANAFRGDYIPKLSTLTQLIRRLKIPCVVIGVGIQAGKAEQLTQGFAFDDKVKDFVSAVLDKSAILGVRGEMTAKYLKHLGFAEERHFTPIGCPSMYMYGSALPEVRKKTITAESRVCVNGKMDSTREIHALMESGCAELPNYWYIPQRIEEIWMMYAGMPIPRRGKRKRPEYLPILRSNRLLREQRSVAFLNVPSWMEFMKNMDLCYGCNIHGNIAAYLAGVPGLVVAKDLRVAEIANYFEIPTIGQEEIRAKVSIIDAYERADFSKVQANHASRFAHYVDFLNENGLDHIFKERQSVTNAPYDQRIAQTQFVPAVYPRESLTLAERADSLPIYRRAVRHYWKKYKNRFKARYRRK